MEGHNKATVRVSNNFISKMGGWELGGIFKNKSLEQGILLNIMIFCFSFFFHFFCVYRCQGVFFHVEKSNIAKYSILPYTSIIEC